jgi:hypothetical protein
MGLLVTGKTLSYSYYQTAQTRLPEFTRAIA